MAYLDKPYQQRQFLMVVNDDRGTSNNEIDVFTPSSLPKGVNFGGKKWTLNTLYIAHPAKVGLYIPFEDHEMAFFNDKMHELSKLCMGLGATQIDLIWEKGEKINESLNTSESLGGSIGVGGKGNGSMEYSNSNRSSSSNSSEKSLFLSIKGNPIGFPKIPEGLEWLHSELAWQRMAELRMLGTETYELKITSKSSSSLSRSETESLKASLKVLIVKASAHYDSSMEKMFDEMMETVWKVRVFFKPLSSYTQNDSKYHQKQGKYSNEHDGSTNRSLFKRIKSIFK